MPRKALPLLLVLLALAGCALDKASLSLNVTVNLPLNLGDPPRK